MKQVKGDLGDTRFSIGKSMEFVKPHMGDLGDPRFPFGKVRVPVTGAHFLHLDVKFLHATGRAQLAL